MSNKVNEEIKFKTVRLVGDNIDLPDGGVVSIEIARKMAEDMGLDLVLMSDKSKPVVCKLMDYGKFQYNMTKNKPKNKPKPMKEMRYTPNTDGNDFNFKLNHVIKFLEKGHKVKAYVFFKGREMNYKEQGQKILLDLIVQVEDYGVPENVPKFEGNKYTVVIKPKQL
jgi:translation initiation factor IF-3